MNRNMSKSIKEHIMRNVIILIFKYGLKSKLRGIVATVVPRILYLKMSTGS